MEPIQSKLLSQRWLQILADPNHRLENSSIQEAARAITSFNKLDKRSLHKALLGIALKWDDGFAFDGMVLVKHLLDAGADPSFTTITQECYCNGINAHYKTSEVMQSISTKNNATGELKKYLESLKR